MAGHIEGPLHWEQFGKHGIPIAFVHPNPMDHSCWTYQMAHLSTWFRCVGIDLPGYGRSPKARPGLSMADVAQACWEAVDELSDEAAILVGLSVGANVVLHMANQQPKRTLAVAVSGVGYSPVKAFTAKRIAQYQKDGIAFRHQHTLEDFSSDFRDTDMARYFADLFTERNCWADLGTIIEMFRAVAEPDPGWLFEGIQAPMLIIRGSQDGDFQRTLALQERIHGCELSVIDGAGHACNIEKPWDWDAHFLRFLTKHGLFSQADETVICG